MSEGQQQIRVGTSGWHYADWAGLFYPEELKKSEWLSFYMQHFDTVEVNNTFYHLPKETSVKNWHKQAAKDFVFTVKASRYITHIKKLKDAGEGLETFYERVGLLGSNLGPVLFQLPPNLHKDIERLSDFLSLLPKRRLAVFEFRQESWYCDEVYELLDKYGIGFCTHDMPGGESPKIVTGKLLYLRLHGTTGRYSGNYPDKILQDWARWIKENAGGRRVFAYFNNDYNAYAVNNAKQLRKFLINQ